MVKFYSVVFALGALFSASVARAASLSTSTAQTLVTDSKATILEIIGENILDLVNIAVLLIGFFMIWRWFKRFARGK